MSPLSRTVAAILVLCGLATFWVGVLVVAAANTGYEHRRDYVSTLASHGSVHGGVGVLAIAAAALAMLAAAHLLRRLSALAALAVALAGGAFLVVAFSRLECARGPAGCGLGGRFAVSGRTEVTHWAATTIGTVLLVAGMVLTGVALVRSGRTGAGVTSLAAAAFTTGAFLAVGGDSPGGVQRVGIAVATGWLAVVALVGLLGRGPAQPPSGG